MTSDTVTPEPLAIRSRRDALMIFGSARSGGCHAADDGLHPVELAVVDRGERVLHLARAGQHAEQVADRTHLADGQHLLEEVLERQLARTDLGGGLLGLLGVEDLLGLLDEGQHVAHAEDAAGHPVGVEDVEVVELLACGREQDRDAGDLAHRQRGTAAGVAVQLGEDDAGESDTLAERLRGGDGVLADHRVDDEQHLVGIDGLADRGGLRHQLVVDAEPARGVDDDDVEVLGPRLGEAVGGHLDRVAGADVGGAFGRCAGVRREDLDARLSPTICSWLTAPGRCRSHATSSGV